MEIVQHKSVLWFREDSSEPSFVRQRKVMVQSLCYTADKRKNLRVFVSPSWNGYMEKHLVTSMRHCSNCWSSTTGSLFSLYCQQIARALSLSSHSKSDTGALPWWDKIAGGMLSFPDFCWMVNSYSDKKSNYLAIIPCMSIFLRAFFRDLWSEIKIHGSVDNRYRQKCRSPNKTAKVSLSHAS